jgi:hypothetical protein
MKRGAAERPKLAGPPPKFVNGCVILPNKNKQERLDEKD